jgi:putative MATE family efflux protein
MNNTQELGTKPIGQLLSKMAIPASAGILVMSIYFIVDTIFVGRFVGTLGIAAITVVMPITFLISSIGMAIGVGGSSIISRALGADNYGKACRTFGNMVSLSLLAVVVMVGMGILFQDQVLRLFGANGDILEPAKEYFVIILAGVPALAWAMMSNNVMRAEGEPKMAMLSMMIPAVANLILDPIFIIWLEWGLEGAAWATTISYYLSAGFAAWFFASGRSELTFYRSSLLLKLPIIREIAGIGGVTLARQGAVSLLSIVLNQTLFQYGSEMAVAIYGIISRIMMFANFPVLGITQGFLPIAGYNYGAQKWGRVKAILNYSIRTGSIIAVGLFTGIVLGADWITALFTTDQQLLQRTPPALILVFMATPLITVQLVGAAYFQAIGKALPALFLTLTKQGFFLIPLVLILPRFFGLDGVCTYGYLRYEMHKTLNPMIEAQEEKPEKDKEEVYTHNPQLGKPCETNIDF